MLSEYDKFSDEEIIEEVIQGNTRAYGELFKRYFDEIYRYVYYRVASDHFEAEDLTQTVFIRAWEVLLKKKTTKYNYRALTYRIAHNLTIDRWRTRKQAISIMHAVQEKDSAPTPDLIISHNEESHELVKAIRELAPQLQTVIICRFINGLSHAETAEAMGLTEGHVRVLQYRALKKIRVVIK